MTYNKIATYKYRETHKEKWDEQMRKNSRAYYERNKEAERKRKLEYYYRKKAELLIKQLSV